MEIGSIVECIKGYPEVIEEGQYYTVKYIGKGIVLHEVSPPEPYTSFLKERFKEVQSPGDFEDIMMDLICNSEIGS
jgi:hypothetical protein